MWVLYSAFSQPLLDAASALPFVILFIADLPISLVAFGFMFTSSEKGAIAAVLWGVLGTLWWFLIGYAIDVRIRNYRKKRVMEAENVPGPSTVNLETNDSRRMELVIALSAVAVVIVASLVWQWNGRQGYFEKGKIGNFAFAPDEPSILLVRSEGDSSRLEKVVLNSGASTPIGKALPCLASSPTYSPDGTRIAFACESKPTELSRIMIMDADGGNLHSLFSSNSDSYDFAPHFTSDGTEIYFGRMLTFVKDTESGATPSRRLDIYSASLDGKDERPLTDRHFGDFGVAFSGDGRKFVLAGDAVSGTRLHLYSLDDPSNGETAIQPLIPNGPRTPVISNVALASDGRSLYFMAASGGNKALDYDVYRSDLVSNAVEKFTTANGYATDLCVSSDGKTAVFLRWTSRWGSFPNLSRLYTLDLATKRLTALNVTGTE
jgi:Tol biopolymer transport system component